MILKRTKMMMRMFCNNQLVKEANGKPGGNLSRPEQTMGQAEILLSFAVKYRYKYKYKFTNKYNYKHRTEQTMGQAETLEHYKYKYKYK